MPSPSFLRLALYTITTVVFTVIGVVMFLTAQPLMGVLALVGIVYYAHRTADTLDSGQTFTDWRH